MAFKERLKGNGSVSDTEWWSYQRTRIELFYRREMTETLIRFDDRSRYRARVLLLQLIKTPNS